MAATYIGTVVGAGFASGQEVLQYFGLFGSRGIAGVAVALIGFFLFGFACMEMGRETGASSYKPVLRKATGKTLSHFMDLVTVFFLFGALSAMISGAGSIIRQEFGLPWIIGAVVMAFVTFITVLTGLKGITYAISSIVPFLLAGVFVIAIGALCTKGVRIALPPPGYLPPVSHWLVSALNYVSYNIFMAAPVLAALGGSLSSTKESVQVAGYGALGLGIGLGLIYITLVSSLPGIANYEIPLARLAWEMGRVGQVFFIGIFFAEVYTTAVANLYGFSARLSAPATKKFTYTALVISVAALCAASTGFSNLVRTIYPLCGWAGTLFMGGLFIYLVKTFLVKK